MNLKSLILIFSLLFCCIPFVQAQSEIIAPSKNMFDQEALKTLFDSQTGSLENLPQVFYNYYVVQDNSRLRARLNLWDAFSLNGQDIASAQGQALLKIMNRHRVDDINFENLLPGDTLYVPTQFGIDLRAYAPFPRYYPGAKNLDKLIILHKEIQAYAAYENGNLLKWGIINTGKEGPDKIETEKGIIEVPSISTPEGRFNVNWLEDERVSSESPEGEEWLMRWVMNIHESRGIHMHQYDIPAGGPASHGCVRIPDADAHWMYQWVDGWKKTGGSARVSGGRIVEQGTMVLVLGPDPKGFPKPFINKRRYPILRIVDLPPDPWLVPPGTDQQKQFDKLRKS